MQLDLVGLAGQPGSEESARPDEGCVLLHFSTLYDEHDDQSGELKDQASGEPYDNATHTVEDDLVEQGMTVYAPGRHEDVLPPLKDGDLADQWLKNYGDLGRLSMGEAVEPENAERRIA